MTAARDLLLDAHGIAVGYGRTGTPINVVLEDFSLRLRADEIVAILGPSGAGKSSLLRVLAGLQAPARGQITRRGEPLCGPHPRVGFVFQHPCLLPWLTLEENVGFGLDFRHQPRITRDEKRERVRAAIAEVGLEAASRFHPSALSGGMMQRAALARSLARHPEILLLDEPFSSLDEITRGEMQALLRSITERHHTTAVLVTHDIDEALVLADRVLLIGGSPARLLDTWRIAAPYPRDEAAPELTRARTEIVHRMRHARHGVSITQRLAA